MYFDIFLNFLLIVYAFILGACVGSFVNMAIYRTNKNLNYLGNSFCDHCKKRLIYKDLIPIVSYIFYKGKSRCCHKKLDLTLPIVELISAMSYSILAYLFLYNIISEPYKYLILIFWIINIPILIFIFFYDLKFFEIPVIPVIVSYISWAIFKVIQYNLYVSSTKYEVLSTQLGNYLMKTDYIDNKISYFREDVLWTLGFALFVFLFFLFLWFITQGRGMGFGDVYFAPLLALISEYPQSPIFLSSSFIIGALFGIVLIIFKGKNMKTAVPFGPFLILGLIIALTTRIILSTL